MKQIMLQGFYRKLLFSLGLALLALLPRQARAVETNTLVTTFEELARTNKHFSHRVIMEKSALKLRDSAAGKLDKARYRSWAIDQLVLLKHLQSYSRQRDEVIALLRHEDPKVRTLALGALFQRGEARDLPFIAPLLEDHAPTFPDLSDDTGSGTYFSVSDEMVIPQSLAAIASAMLVQWGVPTGEQAENLKWLVTKETYTKWTREGSRAPENSTDTAKIPRFSPRQYSSVGLDPDLALYQADTKHVLADLQVLPLRSKAWSIFYLYQMSSGNYFDENALSKAVASSFQELGHDELIRILKYKSDDRLPEILPPFSESFKNDQMKAQFFRDIEARKREWISPSDAQRFILYYGQQLLLPTDVSFLLTGETSADSFDACLWVVTAAELAHRRSPAESRQIINDALPRYPLTDNSHGSNRAALQAVLWRTEGMKASAQLIEWFYAAYDSGSGQYSLLWYLDHSARPDTNELLAALIADKRFDQVKPFVIGEFLEIVNRDLPVPLVPAKEILNRRNDAATAAEWRELLRHHDFSKGNQPASK